MVVRAMNQSAENGVPECVGIILDGNRRWARTRGMPPLLGHREGLAAYKRIVRHANERGIRHLVAYLFSTENWNRSESEVGYLMDLFRNACGEQLKELLQERVRVRFIGERHRFAPDLRELMKKLEDESAPAGGLTAWIGLSYGGRAEIISAARALAEAGGEVSENALRAHMWSAEMPDPDLIIRTSGEQRLSGFLPWQSVYSELFFTDTFWPDFSEAEFDTILAEYAARERRRGK